ncbi:MAG: hypothetical protein CL927_03030 [Deltaproteobacteria bacterium]|nr:hypothetical protein [Deltaproteobacteria bacterium]HCH66655.1 hypothetical protein [Deltaproteobacteria bacterium]
MRTSSRLSMLLPILLLSGCEAIKDKLQGLLGLADLSLVGVTPADGFADPGSVDHGVFFVALGAEDEKGNLVAPLVDLLEVRDESGEPLVVENSEEREGSNRGSMFVLVDESSSLMETDPEEHRKTAVALLAKQLGRCATGWRMTLQGFYGSSENLNEVVPWTDDLSEIEAGADMLSADGATDLYDAVGMSIGMVADDVSSSFNGNDVGAALVVISDGADTASFEWGPTSMLDEAGSAGIPVHTVGLGPASDQAPNASDDLVALLRDLSDVSGGVYGAASEASDLPRVAEAIAKAHCGGYSVLVVRHDDPPESGSLVDGEVGVVDTNVSAPFTFVAP